MSKVGKVFKSPGKGLQTYKVLDETDLTYWVEVTGQACQFKTQFLKFNFDYLVEEKI